jgi:hypothetical protein
MIYIKTILKEGPAYEPQLRRAKLPPVVTASDGQAEEGVAPSLGYLILDEVSGKRIGAYAEVLEDVLGCWTAAEQKISQVELAAPLLTLLEEGEWLKGRELIFLIDNHPALAAAMRGSSRAEDMNRSAHCIQLRAMQLGCRIWFEFIESDSNWADGISRNGITDDLAKELGFQCRDLRIPTWPWEGELSAIAGRIRAL